MTNKPPKISNRDWLKERYRKLNVWFHLTWYPKYDHRAEQLILPRFHDAIFWLWLGCGLCVLSLVAELLSDSFNTFFGRSGALLTMSGLLIELSMQRARFWHEKISNAEIPPEGSLLYISLNKKNFALSWANEIVDGMPVTLWLADTNLAIGIYDKAAFLMIAIGTPIWAYGDLII